MYEQDYIMRMNRDVIRTISKLIFNKDTELPIDITADTLKEEDKIMLESIYGQINLGNINEFESDIIKSIGNKEKRSIEKGLLFYVYLNEQSNEFLISHNFSREKIKLGLKSIASQLGIQEIVNLNYFE